MFNGAGASAISCAAHYVRLGVRRENIVMCDTKGVIYKGRTERMNQYKARFAVRYRPRARWPRRWKGADVFFGLSTANCVTPEMVMAMAPNPIIFALANPDPEIAYDVARAARPDAIMATGRSDFPNQVNNVLGFPFIFRGALDVRATTINDEMKLAATRALADLAKQDVPDSVLRAYGVERMVVRARVHHPQALRSARPDLRSAGGGAGCHGYRRGAAACRYRALPRRAGKRLGKSREIMRAMIHKAQRAPKRVVFAEGEETKILRACQILVDEKIAQPILLGDETIIRARLAELRLHLPGARIVTPNRHRASPSTPRSSTRSASAKASRARKPSSSFSTPRLSAA